MNPRLFGAYLSTLKSAMAANPNANGLMSREDQARQKAQTFEGRLNPNWNGLMSPEQVKAYAKQRPAGGGQFMGNPAPTPKPTPPPGVGQFMGNPRPTPAPTPADTPGAFAVMGNPSVNPQHGSAAQAAFANPNISDEALQHGGYQVPSAPKVPSVPGLKKSTINPRIFGAMIAQLR